ncbi:MAG: hypothetical protein MUE40_09540 [Anaerolineae bacterium]|nr:hypothetical protein [Anaerolineae bacterium]
MPCKFIVVMLLAIATMVIPPALAQDNGLGYCEGTGGGLRCYFNGGNEFNRRGALIDFHLDTPAQDDPDDRLVFSFLEWRNNRPFTVDYFDESFFSLADAVLLDNGNYFVTASGLYALYYLPETDEFQINYGPLAGGVVEVFTVRRVGDNFPGREYTFIDR